MPKLPLAVAAVTSVLVALATGSVAQTAPSGLPLAVVCWNQKTHNWVVAYLQTVQEDGTTVYGTGRLSAKLNAKRVVETPSDRPAILDCFGKTLDQLRATGHLIEVKPTQ